MTRTARATAPAKINLCLAVGSVRADGYHAVDTILHALELTDDVVVRTSQNLTLSCEPSVGIATERNLAYRAALAFASATGLDANVAIELRKRIPHGAGLGGGSSDAAAVIAALAALNDIAIDDPRCIQAASCLGTDVPFFLVGGCAHMTGRGDELVRRLPVATGPVVLVRPPFPVPTAAAYAAFDSDPVPAPACDPVIAALESGSASELASVLANNLEAASTTVVPQVAMALAWLSERHGVLGCMLAGSGSAVFALTEDIDSARAIADKAATMGWWAAATRFGEAGVQVTIEGDA